MSITRQRQCHVCGCRIGWDESFIDHLDECCFRLTVRSWLNGFYASISALQAKEEA